MKGINNRQKMIVKPKESVQKYVLGAGRLQKAGGRQKTRSRPPIGGRKSKKKE